MQRSSCGARDFWTGRIVVGWLVVTVEVVPVYGTYRYVYGRHAGVRDRLCNILKHGYIIPVRVVQRKGTERRMDGWMDGWMDGS